MGCSQSRLDEEETVQLCKHRKEFIKQAVQQQTRFASGHTAYIHSLQKVSAALHDFIEEDHDEPHEFLDSFMRSFTPNTTTVEFVPGSATMKVNYLRPRSNPVVSVEERIQFPEMVQVEEYSPMNKFGIDGLSAMDSSFCSYYSPNNRPNISPPSHQASQWDSYWNPFSSMDYYGYYPTRRNHDLMDEETRGEEGIPDLEEDEIEPEEFTGRRYFVEERTNFGINSSMDATVEEDYDDEDEVECSEEGHDRTSLYALNAQTTGHAQSRHKIMEIDDQDGTEETSGLPFCGEQRPTSMAEVIWDLESQFKVVFFLEQCGERVRIAYEKNCKLFRDHDVKGDDPSSAYNILLILQLNNSAQPWKDVESDGRVSLYTENNPRRSYGPPIKKTSFNFIIRSTKASPLSLHPRNRTEELAIQIRVMDRNSEILPSGTNQLATQMRQIRTFQRRNPTSNY